MSGSSSKTKVVDSELDKEMANIAKERWTHYNEVIVPAENRWIQDAVSQNNENYYDRAAGQGNVATQRAMGLNQAELLEQGGNAARIASATEANARAEQGANTDIQTRMQADQGKRYLGGLQNILAVGSGKEATALNAGSTAATYANQYAMNQASNQKSSLGGQILGMGLGAATRYGMG